MSAEPAPNALVVRSVTKTLRVPRGAVLTLKERAMHPFRRVRSGQFGALRDTFIELMDYMDRWPVSDKVDQTDEPVGAH
jgi:hypothetical protein